MNHVSAHHITAEARPLTNRGIAKLRTRQALMAAAKALFTERGYEEATVRDIARAAGLSTGAVFANFSDKADLFSQILAADDDSLAAAMRPVSGPGQPVADTLMAILRAAYGFHLEQLPLQQAAQAFAWAMPTAALAPGDRHAIGIVEEVIRRAVSAGELSVRADVALTADLIWQAYLSNLRLAALNHAGLDELTSRLQKQLEVIVGGLRP